MTMVYVSEFHPPAKKISRRAKIQILRDAGLSCPIYFDDQQQCQELLGVAGVNLLVVHQGEQLYRMWLPDGGHPKHGVYPFISWWHSGGQKRLGELLQEGPLPTSSSVGVIPRTESERTWLAWLNGSCLEHKLFLCSRSTRAGRRSIWQSHCGDGVRTFEEERNSGQSQWLEKGRGFPAQR